MLFKNSAEELELQEGKLTLRELSLWFGLAPTTISNGSTKSKEKKFNTLKGYAVYHFEGRNIIIDKVTCPVYSKARAIVEKEFPKKWGVMLMKKEPRGVASMSMSMKKELLRCLQMN